MSAVLKPGAPLLAPMREQDLVEVMLIEEAIYSHPWTRGNFGDSLVAGYECRTWRVDAQLVGYFVLMVAAGEARCREACHGQGGGMDLGSLHGDFILKKRREGGKSAAATDPAVSRRRRRLLRRDAQRRHGVVPPAVLVLPFQRSVVDLVHAGVKAGDHALGPAFFRQRFERRDADHRQRARQREALRQAAGDAQTGERPRPGAESNAVKLGCFDFERVKKTLEKR